LKTTTDELLRAEIYGYCRISVDDELDKDNTSIENQKNIIEEYVRNKFPKCHVTFFVDRDCSGYTFEQRENYQKMRKGLVSGKSKILIVKDFSRFSRRNSKGLVELEDLRDAGVRIISITDTIDYPTSDDWMAIQFRFLINEMPVTDTSKKVKKVIQRLQEDGKWLCSCVPYGYVVTNMKKQEIAIEPEAADIVRKIFSLYNEGWGYRKIANYLTDNNIPTPRMKEKERIEARGDEYKRKLRYMAWSDSTVEGIIGNDFYIGTLRQHKVKRTKINGSDIRLDPKENIVFENHHEPIIDSKTWMITQEVMKQRKSTAYRGVKKYDNIYSGFMVCGDCGAPMFANNRSKQNTVYVCSSYHKRGIKACTAHYTRTDILEEIIRQYIEKVRDNSGDMMKKLESSIKNKANDMDENMNTLTILERQLSDAKEELKTIKKRKIKDIAKIEARLYGDTDINEEIDIIDETYSELEEEVTKRISGLQKQISLTYGKRKEIDKINCMTRTVIDVFNDIINKPKLDRTDIQLIIDKIIVYNDHVDIKLKADVDALLNSEKNKGDYSTSNFNNDSKVIKSLEKGSSVFMMERNKNSNTTKVRLRTANKYERLFTVNVLRRGGTHAVEVCPLKPFR
jgi:DNA invertase Pin-like site-specific DNA recombinase